MGGTRLPLLTLVSPTSVGTLWVNREVTIGEL